MRAGALLLLAPSACAAHLQLEAPPATAPVRARVAAYGRLAPKQVERELNPTQLGPFDRDQTTKLVLQDGRKVLFVEDVLPVVPPDSATAAAARRSHAERDRASFYLGVAWATVAGAGAIAAGGLLFDSGSAGRVWLPITGAVAGLVGMIVGMVGFISHDRDAHDIAAEAYKTYDQDLLDYLDLCRDGEAAAACP